MLPKICAACIVLGALVGCKQATILSGPVAVVAPSKSASATNDDQRRPLYYDREIRQTDLQGRTLRELTLMRNTIYARSGNPFRKKWLNDYFSAQPWYRPLPKMDESKLTALDRKNAEIIAQYDAALSKDELEGDQNGLLTSRAQTPEDKIELRLLSVRLGKWAGNDPDRTPLEDPSLLDKQLTVEQLQDFSRRDLRLLRNLIYARRGRPFHSDLLKMYFESIDWYKPDSAYTDARLNALDRRNIKLIRSVEDQLGGPLTDFAHKTEDGWYAQA